MGVKKTHLRLTVAGLMLGLLLASLDATIVSTAIFTIGKELENLENFSWVFTAYIVVSVAATPIFGKLSDMYGRKRFYLFGLIIFIIGSALCGLAQTMEQLIIYRVIQGIGAGALFPLTSTILFDIFPPEQRGKMSGIFGAVNGLASIIGPLLGSYLAEISWHWIFFVNIPLGVAALILTWTSYHESSHHEKTSIDWLGAATFLIGILSLLFALELGGKTYAWNSIPIIALFVSFVVFLILFLWSERRAKDPMVPFHLFRNRVFSSTMILGILYGTIMISAIIYFPLFLQGVFGESPTSSGILLIPFMIGTAVSSVVGGRLIGRLSFKNIFIVANAILLIATGLLSVVHVETAQWVITVCMIIYGLGLGMTLSTMAITALQKVDPKFKGTATSLNLFFRNLGMAVGLAVLTSFQGNLLRSQVDSIIPPQIAEYMKNATDFLIPQIKKLIPVELYAKLTEALAGSIVSMFFITFIITLVALLVAFMMGNAREDRSRKSLESE